MIKKLLSFFTPIIEQKIPSQTNKQLEITWNNGRLVLDTENTNYSFGNLEKVLRKGLKYVGFSKIRNMENALILGLGGGSIIHLLRKDIKFKGTITSIELDPAIIFVANEYFNLDALSENHTIMQMDAFEYVLTTEATFDLIVIDIFKDAEMPAFLFEKYFIDKLKSLLNLNGFIIFNTIVLNKKNKNRNNHYTTQYEADIFSVKRYPNMQNLNEVITIKRHK
ncbi:spermidine synthase [Myroides indicus]|uniref:Spermidine synthase n=1 Tax=Myroides indicus TaxID=1323422 RepID=A0A4R7F3S3_9FLAO|nr:fused MFS/spermidine synthase [Myroides indicus]TDS64238.1 spermidine synthase [Myroides indicus]